MQNHVSDSDYDVKFCNKWLLLAQKFIQPLNEDYYSLVIPQNTAMMKFIALALIAFSATDAYRLDIIGGKNVDPPGMKVLLWHLY